MKSYIWQKRQISKVCSTCWILAFYLNNRHTYITAITYARRYALTAMLGMITEDDDGESAKMPVKPYNNVNRSANAPNAQTAQAHNAHQQSYQDQMPDSYSDADMLPQLEGVTYQYTTTQDGRQCIIATGKTHPKKEILNGAGFRWDAQRKIWWKYADAS